MERLKSGATRPRPFSSLSFWRSFSAVLPCSRLGLKVGNDAIASTAPVRASSATIEPPSAESLRPTPSTWERAMASLSASSAASWRSRSSVSRTLAPGSVGRETKTVPSGLPCASTRSRSSPSRPRRKRSYVRSMPPTPTVSPASAPGYASVSSSCAAEIWASSPYRWAPASWFG